MKKLLSILGAVGLTATGASSVVACNKQHKEQKLSDIIKTTNLETIKMKGNTPTKHELLVGIKAKNSNANNLTENDFDIEGNPTTISAKIIGKGNYTGIITLSYTKKIDKIDISNEKINWSDVTLSLTTPDSLTSDDVKDAIKTVQNQIVINLQSDNKLKNITPQDYTVSGIENVIKENANLLTKTNLKFTITGKGEKYVGKLTEQTINIKAKKIDKIDISNEKINWSDVTLSLTTPDSLTSDDVKDAIKTVQNQIVINLQSDNKLKNITPQDYTVSGIENVIKENANLLTKTNLKFTITGKGEKYVGKLTEQTINIKAVPIVQKELSEIITNSNLKNTIEHDSSTDVMIERFKQELKQEYPSLYINYISIKDFQIVSWFEKEGSLIIYSNNQSFYTGEVSMKFYYTWF